MGFPNTDLFLCKKFEEQFAATQADPDFTVDDLFEDLDEGERLEITEYLQGLTFTQNLRERGEEQRYVYILPHFPMVDMPFPQIGISLGQESAAERFLGDYTGEAIPVEDEDGKVIAFDIPKGYYAAANWNIDIICPTKDEAVWLSRFCQLFVCRLLEELDAMGVVEVSIALADVTIPQEHLPHVLFNRRVTISAKAANTWKKRVPATYYDTGINKALSTLQL